jgi:hypothetical protein
MMISNKNSYALLNHAIIKIPGPLNSPVRDGSVNPFFSTRWMSKTVLAVAGKYYQVTVPLVRLDFPMRGLGDLKRACAFRQTR